MARSTATMPSPNAGPAGRFGERPDHRLTYELTPVDPTATLVTETYDCSRAPEWLRHAVKGGSRWIDSMTATLERLAALVRTES